MLTPAYDTTFNQAAVEICIPKVGYFNKILAEITKYSFPAYAFREQKRYLNMHHIKLRIMKLCSFVSRLQELNTYSGELTPDALVQETSPFSTDELMDIIYHSMPIKWKNKMIE